MRMVLGDNGNLVKQMALARKIVTQTREITS